MNVKTVNTGSFGSIELISSHTYPIPISDADISSLLNKAFHSEVTVFASCNVQGSLLIKRKTQILIKVVAAVAANACDINFCVS